MSALISYKDNKEDTIVLKSGGKWIQKATKNMRKDKPCTGAKFGGPTCPAGSKRYDLLKTFKKMLKHENGGLITYKTK